MQEQVNNVNQLKKVPIMHRMNVIHIKRGQLVKMLRNATMTTWQISLSCTI